MREIKFRAWDKKNKKMVGDKHLEYLCVGKNDVIVLVEYEPTTDGTYEPKSCRQLLNPEVNNLKLMQYTGLKDKNSKEIYEGDIVRGGNKIYQIGFNEGTFTLNDNKGEIGIGLIKTEVSLEIIGNIYENKNLIK